MGRPTGLAARTLSCSRCHTTINTRVAADPDTWPLHRCIGRTIATFDTAGPFRLRLRFDDPFATDLAPAGAGRIGPVTS
jgi:hypothetical protein